uniref:Uncharacterized protein n=1 Tax=Polysiphonia infestans TaxID=2006978 RepID=A0A1Z1MEU7_9FLOR|nr:hypothetical protein [Polysiphonia infestans]ARW64264.1 hypothetical protein [Polysiphonia infestans]
MNNNLFLLKDFNVFLDKITISRKVKNLQIWLKRNNKYVFMSGTKIRIPKNLHE